VALGTSLAEALAALAVATTAAQTATKVCTLKIPDSFPDICAIIEIVENSNEDDEAIATRIVTAMWAASLNWDATCQAANRAAVEEAWNSWGKSAGKKTNAAGQALAFDASIYANQALDKVLLRNVNGTAFRNETVKITREILLEYIAAIKAATQAVVVSDPVPG